MSHPILEQSDLNNVLVADEQTLLSAEDPTESPAALAQLSGHVDPQVRALVARNPNTPEHTLWKLWVEFPLAILENPLLAYRSFSTGKPVGSFLPQGNMLALYGALRDQGRNNDVESWLPRSQRVQWLGNSWQSCDADKLITDEHLLRIRFHLATDPCANVRAVMFDRVGTEVVHVFAHDEDSSIRLALAKRLGILLLYSHGARAEDPSGGIAEILSKDNDEGVRVAVASFGRLGPAAHLRLAKDPSAAVRRMLAERGGCDGPEEAGWRELLKGGKDIHAKIAANQYCPESIRLELTDHEDGSVREAAWRCMDLKAYPRHGKLREKVEQLLVDPSRAGERMVVAASQSLPPALVSRLVDCEAETTRVLARNSVLDDHHRSLLLNLPDRETACFAIGGATSTPLLKQGLRHPDPKVRCVLVRRPLPYMRTLRFRLAVDPVYEVRKAVLDYLREDTAHFHGVGISRLLSVLSRDPCPRMRVEVLQDFRTLCADIQRLRDDPSVSVRLAVLKRQSWLIATDDNGLLSHKHERVRRMAASIIVRMTPGDSRSSQRTHRRLLRKIATDPSTRVRVVAAASGSMPRHLLELLIRDPSPEVQWALTERFLILSARRLGPWTGYAKTGALDVLETSRSPYCRAIAASSKRIGKRRALRLAKDRNWYVRAMLAKNFSNQTAIPQLAEDPHPVVREIAREKLSQQDSANAAQP